jgi:HEAT repeats
MFYGQAVLVLIGGPAYFFRIGRAGMVQVMRWYRRMPAPPQLSSDDYKKMAGLAGIPTSPSDLLLSSTPIGQMETFGSGFTLLTRSRGLAFVGAVIGGLFGRLWYIMALSLIALSVVLHQEGIHYYWPQWLTGLGVTSVTISFYIIGLWFVAYLIGRKIGSPQRSYNTACLAFDRVVSRRGYWFDNRNDADHYHEYIDSLEGALRELDRSLNKIGEAPTSEVDRWQAITILYQRSLVQATLGRYDDARKALEAARRLTESLKGSSLWGTDVDQEQVTESQLLFLKGELLVVCGDRERARPLFEQSRSIDLKLGDRAGVKLNEERLAAISAPSPSSRRAATMPAHNGPATSQSHQVAAARIAATAPATRDRATPGSRQSTPRSHSAVVNADHGASRPQGEPAQPALHVNAGWPMPASTARTTPRMRLWPKPNVSKLAAKRDLVGLIKARDYWHREVVTQMCLANQAEHTIGPQTRALSRLRNAGLLPADVPVTIRSALSVYAKATWKRDRAMNEEETAVTSLGEIGGSFAIESLISALCDSSRDFHYTQYEWGTIQAAIAALKQAGPAAVEPLIGILRDENPQVRDSAARALGAIGDLRAVQPLHRALKEQSAELRPVVEKALRELGVDAK